MSDLMQWADVADSEIDDESPVDEQLVGKFWQREEALISQHVDTRFAQADTTATAFAALAGVGVYVPAAAKTSGGAKVAIRIVLEAKLAGATGGELRARIIGGTYSAVASVSSSDWTRVELVIPAADVGAAADGDVGIAIEGRVSAGSGTLSARCQWGASRLERSAS